MGKMGRTAGPPKKEDAAYWRGYGAAMQGLSRLAAGEGQLDPNKRESFRLGHAAGRKARDGVPAAQAAQVKAKDGRPVRSTLWKAGYGAGVRGEGLGNLLWQVDRPLDKADLEDGYAVGRRKFVRQKA